MSRWGIDSMRGGWRNDMELRILVTLEDRRVEELSPALHWKRGAGLWQKGNRTQGSGRSVNVQIALDCEVGCQET